MTTDVSALQELPEVDTGTGPAAPHAVCIPPTCVVTGCRGTRTAFAPLADSRPGGESRSAGMVRGPRGIAPSAAC
jgi:hypothetical protein